MKAGSEAKPEPRSTASLGQRIKAVRLDWRWSQGELAHALRVDQASISYWEHDKVRPSGSGLLALASLFRTSAQAMEEGTGFRIPEPPSRPEAARGVGLPWDGGEVIRVIDLADGSSRASALDEGMMSLVQGFQAHRRAWVVLA